MGVEDCESWFSAPHHAAELVPLLSELLLSSLDLLTGLPHLLLEDCDLQGDREGSWSTVVVGVVLVLISHYKTFHNEAIETSQVGGSSQGHYEDLKLKSKV